MKMFDTFTIDTKLLKIVNTTFYYNQMIILLLYLAFSRNDVHMNMWIVLLYITLQ